ncbi:hypothetical protein Lqui_1022 [Legionella quinlivanii]|uniref:Gloeo_Verruco repeat protein n=1 Tax=Legionella quinlivanii TaxID=45073 RepID=A0A0W0Y6A6_9GAMM|nr:choice-of-anchor tandem repeat GloVer-containing protein [Legionella quinlivanii]KTD52178.1 hypothetical protein Lqui_1022 [Legionella quinlivanii]SEF76534.1 hypothetical protein SAMN02746093_01031 [Legionella quinlivanii DSM 21216]STY12323.1 gloeo_Verruco repeat [Legionella quinlivanii]
MRCAVTQWVSLFLFLHGSCAISQENPFSMLYSFDYYLGSAPQNALIISKDQTLYGHTDSFIYQFKLKSAKDELGILQEAGKQRDGARLNFTGELTLDKEQQFLYGVRNGFLQGDVFKMSIDGRFFQVLHEADIETRYADGYDLKGGLVLSPDEHFLYGAAESGGLGNEPRSTSGVIYRISLDNSLQPAYEVIHAFKGQEDENGSAPAASMALSRDGHDLYGITSLGGSKKCGSLFKIENADSSEPHFKHLHSFDCNNEADSRNGGIPEKIILNEKTQAIYGIAYKTSHWNNSGIIFKIDLSDESCSSTVLHEFSVHDGIHPQALVLSPNGKTLFGATNYFGSTKSNYGTIFKLDLEEPKSGFEVLHVFTGANGQPMNPGSGLCLAADTLYGVTEFGGKHGSGGLFEISL